MSRLQVSKLETLDEMSALIEDRGHDFWVGTYADCDHFDCMTRCQNSLVCDDMRADEVFTHGYTLTCSDIKTSSNVLFSRFGLGLRRKRVGSKDTDGCMYLLINKDGETALHRRRSRIANDDPRYRLSSEVKLRNTTLVFTHVDKRGFMQTLAKTKAFWLSAFSNITSKDAPKQVMNTTVEGKSPEKLFSHCYLMDSANCRADCDEFYKNFGFGVRQNRVRAKEATGTVYCLVATKKPDQQANVTESVQKARIADAVANAPSPKKEELIAPVNVYKHGALAAHKQTAQTSAPASENVPVPAQKDAHHSVESEVTISSASSSGDEGEEVRPPTHPRTRRVLPDELAAKRGITKETAAITKEPVAITKETAAISKETAVRTKETVAITKEPAAKRVRIEEPAKASAMAPSTESIAEKQQVKVHNTIDKTWEERRLKDQTSMIRHMVRQLYPTLMKQSMATGVPVTAEQVREKVEDGLALPRHQKRLAAFNKEISEYWEHLRGLFD